MKRRQPSRSAIQAALEFQALRTSDRWLVHWLNRAPTIARYQEPVCLARVLAEHHAAIAAQPVGEHQE